MRMPIGRDKRFAWALRAVLCLQLLLVAGVWSFSCCTRYDEFSAPSMELRGRLAVYLRDHDARPIFEWVTQYHGEAPGHQMMIVFVSWGNEHPRGMQALLDSWPEDSRGRVVNLLLWAAEDSGQQVLFKTPLESLKQQQTGDRQERP